MIIEETTEVEEKDQGFTLVELLIVIVILGILATIVVFAVRGITDQGQKSSCKATAKTYEVAIEAYYAKLRQRHQPRRAPARSRRTCSAATTARDVQISVGTPSDVDHHVLGQVRRHDTLIERRLNRRRPRILFEVRGLRHCREPGHMTTATEITDDAHERRRELGDEPATSAGATPPIDRRRPVDLRSALGLETRDVLIVALGALYVVAYGPFFWSPRGPHGPSCCWLRCRSGCTSSPDWCVMVIAPRSSRSLLIGWAMVIESAVRRAVGLVDCRRQRHEGAWVMAGALGCWALGRTSASRRAGRRSGSRLSEPAPRTASSVCSKSLFDITYGPLGAIGRRATGFEHQPGVLRRDDGRCGRLVRMASSALRRGRHVPISALVGVAMRLVPRDDVRITCRARVACCSSSSSAIAMRRSCRSLLLVPAVVVGAVRRTAACNARRRRRVVGDRPGR